MRPPWKGEECERLAAEGTRGDGLHQVHPGGEVQRARAGRVGPREEILDGAEGAPMHGYFGPAASQAVKLI